MFGALVLILLSGAAAAQTAVAVTGLVRDSSGGAIPGVIVRVVNEQTGAAVEAVSDAQGAYRAEVGPGRYKVEAVLDGFENASKQIVVEAAAVTSDITLEPARFTEGVVVTARRVEEEVQEVPIPVSVVTGNLVADAGAFNVNRLKELVPTVQFYSSNPRNSSINIRGLGAPFGLTNDGIEPGVGLYIDGTFFARPAAATLDFLDVERVEVLRGPQGTLFGKNTTSGAIHVTTRKPSFTRGTEVELNYGSLGLVQAKASTTGGLSSTIAGRVSFSGTTREGAIRHTRTGQDLNGLNNLGVRGQLLYAPSADLAITVAADHTRQRPQGYAQVAAGVAPTLRPANRQYAQIAADLGYAAPSLNAFDRLTDTDTAWESNQDLGGATLTIDKKAGSGRLTAISAWRYWNWDPSNDRDFVGLPVTTISANPSKQRQLTQEFRYAAEVNPSLNYVVGLFGFRQTIDSTGKQEQGSAAARFLLAPSALASTPGLLDGYGQTSAISATNVSAAAFGQFEWTVTKRLRLLPGLRFNYDDKRVDFDTQVYGGLQTSDPALIALQRSVLAPQSYQAGADDTNLSGQLTAAFQAATRVQHVRHLRDQLQVDRPQPVGRAHRRVGPAGAGPRHGEARGRAPHRSRREDRTVPRRDRERHRVRHHRQGLPGQRRERAGWRAARVSGQRRQGARARAGVRRQRAGASPAVVLRRAGLHRWQVRVVPGRAATARGDWRAAGQGRVRLGAARHLEGRLLARRRYRRGCRRVVLEERIVLVGPEEADTRGVRAHGIRFCVVALFGRRDRRDARRDGCLLRTDGRVGDRVAALGDRARRREVRADERLTAGRRRLAKVRQARGISAAARAVGHPVEVRAVDRAKRSDGRRLVTRDTGAKQARHGDRRDDADDSHDDQQLDQRETFVASFSHVCSPL